MKDTILLWGLAALLVGGGVTFRAADTRSIAAKNNGDARRPVLVELFTSEGCSSCPPADHLLQTLDKTQPVAGAEVIVLGEHVDYWNYMGWTDRFSSKVFTDRQGGYADRFRLDGVYTPQMVVDGGEEFVGSNTSRAEEAIAKAANVKKIAVRLSSVLKTADGNWLIRIETDAVPVAASVYLALAEKGASSQVSRGENSGHQLTHVAPARSLRQVGQASAGHAFSQDIRVPLEIGWEPQGMRVIAFLQEPNQGRVLGAAVRSLEP